MTYPPTHDRLRHLVAQEINPHVDSWKRAFFLADSIVTSREVRAELDRIATAHAAGQPCGDQQCRRCFEIAVEIRTAARQTTGQDDTEATPCSGPVACGDEPCDRHEREQTHAEGEHALCGPECECTCATAGPEFVPAGHYRDCPQYTEPETPEPSAVNPACTTCNGAAVGQTDTGRACPHGQGTGADPEDQGDYDPNVHMHNPTTIGPCPECHGTGKDAPAVGQPAEAHDIEARTRQLILNCLTGRAVCPAPRPVDEATGLLDAYRAAVLREAADRFAAFDLHTEAAALRRMADGSQP